MKSIQSFHDKHGGGGEKALTKICNFSTFCSTLVDLRKSADAKVGIKMAYLNPTQSS